MKKTYKSPVLRTIDLFEEGAILTGSNKLEINDTTADGGEFQSQKKEQDLWGNESVWK